MYRHRWSGGASIALALLLTGCVLRPPVVSALELPVTTGQVRSDIAPLLASTPFFPQRIHQCGPAALATVLVASGVATTPGQLAARVYLPGRAGSLQAEMIAAARRLGRVPYPVGPDPAALAAEVAAGHPVLVLQNLGLRSWPRWHYAVVIGIDERQVVLRSGRHAELRMSRRSFERSWQLAGSWAFVALQPGAWPADATPARWLGTYAAFEQTGESAIARRGYEAGVERWPDDAKLWFALGNARYAAHELPAATAAYQRATQLDPALPEPWNNLAQSLVDQGCRQQAAAALVEAQSRRTPALAAAIDDTEAALARLPAAVEPQACLRTGPPH